MKKFLDILDKDRVLLNMIFGGIRGIGAWIFCLIFEKAFGISTAFNYLSFFIIGGVTIGTIVGIISQEIRWHKKEYSKKD